MTRSTQLTGKYLQSLNRNIILIVILVSVIPLVIVSSTIYLQFRASYRGKVYDHLRELEELLEKIMAAHAYRRRKNPQMQADAIGFGRIRIRQRSLSAG